MRNNTRNRGENRDKNRCDLSGRPTGKTSYGLNLALMILSSLEWEANRVNTRRPNLPARIKSLLRTQSFTELKALPMPDPGAYDNAKLFAIDYQAYNLVRKGTVELLETSVDRRKTALDAYLTANAACRATTARLDGHYSPLIEAIRGVVACIIGESPDLSWLRHCTFTNGATATTTRADGLGKKLTGDLAVTRSCLPYLRAALSTDFMWLRAQLYGWDTETDEPIEVSQNTSCGITPILVGPVSLLESNFTITDYEIWDSVPKTAFTDRSIGKQPLGNVYVQKGIDAVLRSKLLKIGVDLSDQTQNQNWAWLGSRFGKYATLDLSSASDSISVGLIRALLPERWYALLNAVRCKFTQLPDGSIVPLELFSSMGNAFTFSLETIVFYAISYVACDYRFKPVVYGDDIIVPVEYANSVQSALSFFGMKTNRAKTFAAGPFRESCGAHYWNGSDVKPFLIERNPDESEQETARIVNQLRCWTVRVGLWSGCYAHSTDQPWSCSGSNPSAVEISIALLSGEVDFVGYRSAEDLWASLVSALLFPGGLLNKPIRALIPFTGNDDGSTEGLEIPDPPRRWNTHLQRWEYRRWVPYSPTRRDPVGYAWGAITGAGAKALPVIDGRVYIVSHEDSLYAISQVELTALIGCTAQKATFNPDRPYLLAVASCGDRKVFSLRYS